MKKSKLWLSALSAGGLALTLSSPARAQTDEAASSPPPPPPAAVSSSSSSGGGAGIGVGATAWLSGLAGGTIVYDQYIWSIEGMLSFASASAGGGGPRTTEVIIGASGWYHLSHGANSDFSLGGGIGFADLSGGGNSVQAFVIEPGAQARVFLTPNVTLNGRVGLAMVFGDNGTAAGQSSAVSLSGQTVGGTAGFGFTYFFR